jgi:stage II sporulation protein D
MKGFRLTGALALIVACGSLGMATMGMSEASPTSSLHGSTLTVGLWTLWHDKEIAVSADRAGRATLRRCSGCAAEPIRGATQISAVEGGISLNESGQIASVSISGTVTIAAHGETLVMRNPLRIGAHNGVLVMAVTLPVESYVERVVASESGAADTSESLKALAIVVRSFALHQAHGHADFDLCDSTHCQLLHWGGSPGRTAAAHAATLATAGETLWFHGQRAAAWFHQNCGGRTAVPEEVWPGRGNRAPLPWLVSRVDPYCTAGGAREWSASLSLGELTGALASAGLVRPGWKNLAVVRRGDSGRAVTLQVDAAQISAEDFRLAVGRALGWGKILSNWYEVSRQGDQFMFHGRGSGHGVGLCQAGAAAMSAQGRDATQILAQYFPGAAAADETTGKAWQSFTGPGFVLETLDAGDAAFLQEMADELQNAESNLGFSVPQTITVRAFRSTPAFRDATLAPGWVAAFTEGNWIGTQPMRTLAARKMLIPVLRHEFMHALVESVAAPQTPLWLREGLVETSGGNKIPAAAAPALKLEEVDRALRDATTEAQSGAAHRAAGWYAWKLVARSGRKQVLEWLRHGLPANALAGIG